MRLTEWYDDGEHKGIMVKEYPIENSMKTLYCKYGNQSDYSDCDEGYLAMEQLMEYENALEDKRMTFVPCSVGDTLYVKMQDGNMEKATVTDLFPYGTIRNNELCNVVLTSDSGDVIIKRFSDFGKSLFLKNF